ncbi:nuclear transport factor 2 family protein [Mucilaginibacter lacusdianchii]|uniref:nuclear transport factor 2 family protein n=1 Tax=Mucilaginibacter lacusdianchii TaxID=2684211 RepID=UPI00131D79DE|nr:nuclear transport factor 2 family protein [Mucilaginibacter sp. JXJ CY 39]
MKKALLLLSILINAGMAFSQSQEHGAVKQVVDNLFTAMRTSDTTLLKSVFHEDMVLQSVANKREGGTALITEKAADFIKSIAALHKEVYDERIEIKDIKIDGQLASVWANYKFYVGSTFSHCGVDVFQLMKMADGWKIIYIADTRRKGNCPE